MGYRMIDYYKIKDRIYDNELYMKRLSKEELSGRDFLKTMSLYVSNLEKFNKEEYEKIKSISS